MKGLFKYLTPFAPDQSGAVSVLYEFGGLIVICDAGGCVGNICGFDEPRWREAQSAIFSAGLRDMDAIMGRDERLVKKLELAVNQIEGNFAAVIGTPVPAVIATDYHALARMIQRKTHLPVIAVETTGMSYYDKGAETAYLELFRKFCAEKEAPTDEISGASKACMSGNRMGVLGANPLDLGDLLAARKLRKLYKDKDVVCYGTGAGFCELERAAYAEKNLVVAPSGLKAARYLKERFGTEYEIDNPLALEYLADMDYSGKKVLVLHQQVSAHTLRRELKKRGAADVKAATFFMQIPELKEEGDVHLDGEDQCEALISDGEFDVIIADPVFRKMAKNFKGIFIDYPQFAVSGKLAES